MTETGRLATVGKAALHVSLLTLVLATGIGRAWAYHEVGAGVDVCTTWTADRQNPTGEGALQDEQWVVGFLTGIGFAGSDQDDPLNGVDAVTVWRWIDVYCRAHPADKIVTAARALFKAHRH